MLITTAITYLLILPWNASLSRFFPSMPLETTQTPSPQNKNIGRPAWTKYMLPSSFSLLTPENRRLHKVFLLPSRSGRSKEKREFIVPLWTFVTHFLPIRDCIAFNGIILYSSPMGIACLVMHMQLMNVCHENRFWRPTKLLSSFYAFNRSRNLPAPKIQIPQTSNGLFFVRQCTHLYTALLQR